MKAKNLLTMTALALTLGGSVAATAQSVKPTVKPGTATKATQQVISLQARVESLDARGRTVSRAGEMYGVKPAEAIPIRTGERLRVNLVGTRLVNGRGVEAPINATFSQSAGRDNLSIVQTGPNWVIVEARGRGSDKRAQLAYNVANNYDMKAGLAQGYLTFEIDSRGVGSPVAGGRDSTRWERSEDLTEMLYRSILDRNLGGTYAQDDVEHIYYLGYRGLQEVARELARETPTSGGWTESTARQELADLYRVLLRRDQSERELWDQDSGFRTNVDNLRRNGLERVVQTIVESEEFRRVHDLNGFDQMALRDQRYDGDWRGYRTARRN
ncbi:MAG TPA: hypothetical protein VHN15_00435 [Thermoanaerobaculia bacterium]|nr:hypothetical protein [Thermoanaerobaculia bacterium]